MAKAKKRKTAKKRATRTVKKSPSRRKRRGPVAYDDGGSPGPH
jgi:hypothetical protein